MIVAGSSGNSKPRFFASSTSRVGAVGSQTLNFSPPPRSMVKSFSSHATSGSMYGFFIWGAFTTMGSGFMAAQPS